MQQSVTRLLARGTGSVLQALQAAAPNYAAVGSSSGVDGRFTAGQSAGSGSCFHVPTFFSTFVDRDDDARARGVSPRVPGLDFQNVMASRKTHPAGMMYGPMGMANLPFANRGICGLISRHGLSSVSKPAGIAVKGLGVSLPERRLAPSTPTQTRSYLTEGEMLGAAYLSATDIMFWSGLIGAVVFRRNLIVMLLCTEIVMLACNMNFLFAAAYLNDMTGVIMSITITTIAACETAIGLALCVTYFHIRSATDVEALNLLK